jgi:hypothetical protein
LFKFTISMHIFRSIAAKITQLCSMPTILILLLNQIVVFVGLKLNSSAQTKKRISCRRRKSRNITTGASKDVMDINHRARQRQK